MLAALLANLPQEEAERELGGRPSKTYGWLRANAENMRLAQEQDDILNVVVSFVLAGGGDGSGMR